MTATTTSIPALAVETAALEQVTEDLYRDIHKGIRAELFAVTAAAGRVDPGDADAVRAVGDQWRRVVFVLVSHSEHEDQWVQPVLERHSPTLAAQVAREHPQLEAHMAALEILADRAAEACPADRRLLVHRMYLGFASFTAAYLQHQEVEEFQVMTLLSKEIPVAELQALHGALVASIPPDELAASAAVMLPAMNVEDRVGVLGGIQAAAPPEAFAGMMGLAESVLDPADYRAVADRLGVA
ncbi:MAG TPA: hemerythrin domain-containing protein [Acidimicrobiia bacterium]|nr:hemerythrin domain-containing protein [Acidimicrobiia bacterium]